MTFLIKKPYFYWKTGILQYFLKVWRLVELKILDFTDPTRTGISILTSTSYPTFTLHINYKQMLDSFCNKLYKTSFFVDFNWGAEGNGWLCGNVLVPQAKRKQLWAEKGVGEKWLKLWWSFIITGSWIAEVACLRLILLKLSSSKEFKLTMMRLFDRKQQMKASATTTWGRDLLNMCLHKIKQTLIFFWINRHLFPCICLVRGISRFWIRAALYSARHVSVQFVVT